jgi:hypothetical protein
LIMVMSGQTIWKLTQQNAAMRDLLNTSNTKNDLDATANTKISILLLNH